MPELAIKRLPFTLELTASTDTPGQDATGRAKMELKNAVAICLISFFSATLVVLIARALDIQAASRLEPQLTRIADQLEAIRKHGGIASPSGGSEASDTIADGLIVYYFHSNIRCPTCRAIESQSHEVVQTDFDSLVKKGDITWKVLNYEQVDGQDLAKKFEVQMPVVVIVRMQAGEIEDWRRLDKVWALVNDKPAFAKYVRDAIEQMRTPSKTPDSSAPSANAPQIPLPSPDIPVP